MYDVLWKACSSSRSELHLSRNNHGTYTQWGSWGGCITGLRCKLTQARCLFLAYISHSNAQCQYLFQSCCSLDSCFLFCSRHYFWNHKFTRDFYLQVNIIYTRCTFFMFFRVIYLKQLLWLYHKIMFNIHLREDIQFLLM